MTRLTCMRVMALVIAAVSLASVSPAAPQVEFLRLSKENWDRVRPKGKEVDAIHGDYVLRNKQLVAVIAQPVKGRNANMTVRGVGGCLIDLTRRDRQRDQLSAFYPGGVGFGFTDHEAVTVTEVPGILDKGDSVNLSMVSAPNAAGIRQTVRYMLAETSDRLLVESIFENTTDHAVTIVLEDAVRADRTFKSGRTPALKMHWVVDEWFGQAYGFLPVGHGIELKRTGSRPFRLRYLHEGSSRVSLEPGARHSLRRWLVPAATQLELLGRAQRLRKLPTRSVHLRITDEAGPVDRARVTLFEGERLYGSGLTNSDPVLAFLAPERAFRVRIEGIGRPAVDLTLPQSGRVAKTVRLELPGIVVAAVTDQFGRPIPCKVAFKGLDQTKTPYFGPDSAAFGVHNLVYTPTGRFRRELEPGRYEVVISHGPEYDAAKRRIDVPRGKVFVLHAQLRRVVDTSGWVSTDFHSHASPSGDNTASQLGRVLNLLCEHIEFAPCTEHNRLSTYVAHLERLGAGALMATCTGIELTRSPGDVDHQNAFPLVMYRGHQDNGAPLTDANPVVQIERLAFWDGKSAKLVQTNHPNIAKIIGKHEAMMSFMDVIEVHPPGLIFSQPKPDPKGRVPNNRMFRWLQALNIGHRVPGVVNTDAHYTFHGSGWLRNYIKSPTDDPAEIQTLDIVHAAEQGHIVMTNGPFLEVSWHGADEKVIAIPGMEVAAKDGWGKLHLRVQCANWLDINRVQLFFNGRPVEQPGFTRSSHPKLFGESVVKFTHQVRTVFEEDTHIVVAVIGEGLTLGPVIGGPHGRDRPIAVSNPIFLDVDGKGFHPNGDLLGVPLPRQGR